MLSFRHPLIFIFGITNHQRTHNLVLRRHSNHIQQRLIACNTAGLDKTGDSCSQTNGRSKQLCIGPALLCIAHTGNIQTACKRKNQTGRIAGDNNLSTLTVSAQHHLKITFIFGACSNLSLHPFGNSIGNSTDLLLIAYNDIVHAL